MAAEQHLLTLHREIAWLELVINEVIRSYLQQEGYTQSFPDLPPPDLDGDSPYAEKVRQWELDSYGRLALALGLAPHLRPEVLDIFFGKNQLYDRGFSEFGGAPNTSHSGFMPTEQTLIFLATALHPQHRNRVTAVLDRSHPLRREQVLLINPVESPIPPQNGVLALDPGWLHYFCTGESLVEEQSAAFPAQRITTAMDWEDIVLEPHVMEQVNEIESWMRHGHLLMGEWGLQKRIKPGYRALFYGPPGTGKTLTATLLGKASGRDVYKVDLSMIVSKWVGETEKNLARVFDIAEHRDWILFFDEADALFGKRTEASSSNDRYANQQTSYLLQRIESFPGVVLLASNLKANMDAAFARRFQAMIHFPIPGPTSRFQLWQAAFSGTCRLDPAIDLWKVSEEYDLAGGAIINVLRYCALSAVGRGDTVVRREELMEGLRREFKKENKTLQLL